MNLRERITQLMADRDRLVADNLEYLTSHICAIDRLDEKLLFIQRIVDFGIETDEAIIEFLKEEVVGR